MTINEVYNGLDKEQSADYVLSADKFEIRYMNPKAVEYTPSVTSGKLFCTALCGRKELCPDCPLRNKLKSSPVKVAADSLCSFANVTFCRIITETEELIISRWKEDTGDLIADCGYFDLAKALDSLGNDREVYDAILKTYLEDGQTLPSAITDCYAAKDYKNLRIKVHGLKSASYVVGANDLGDLAKKLEYACRRLEGDDSRSIPGDENEDPLWIIDNNIGKLISDYNSILDVTVRYLTNT